ncbi:unnamed protein product [Chondrus crispus]|uniref:Uncharacterized protein n=1 Tax=Chondrus crispus TaxID=2769 RepID=R7QPP8_CHOCR|nr:unnamed protein product [Chondrus crispus]CDF39456.1 unnamed protein product [Chondrus crispus]|eukprot:XP_005719367.1 unnamed protein product [Chondrus crispus]
MRFSLLYSTAPLPMCIHLNAIRQPHRNQLEINMIQNNHLVDTRHTVFKFHHVIPTWCMPWSGSLMRLDRFAPHFLCHLLLFLLSYLGFHLPFSPPRPLTQAYALTLSYPPSPLQLHLLEPPPLLLRLSTDSRSRPAALCPFLPLAWKQARRRANA